MSSCRFRTGGAWQFQGHGAYNQIMAGCHLYYLNPNGTYDSARHIRLRAPVFDVVSDTGGLAYIFKKTYNAVPGDFGQIAYITPEGALDSIPRRFIDIPQSLGSAADGSVFYLTDRIFRLKNRQIRDSSIYANARSLSVPRIYPFYRQATGGPGMIAGWTWKSVNGITHRAAADSANTRTILKYDRHGVRNALWTPLTWEGEMIDLKPLKQGD